MSEDLKDEQDRDSFQEIREEYAERLRKRVANGEKLTPEELSFLEAVKAETADEFPDRLHVAPPRYPRSPAQRAQARKNLERINNEKLQTGPKTSGGKARASRNAIKHGQYAQSYMSLLKPCFSTCPEYPCALVEEGRTEPGDHCLDKQHFVEALDAIEKAMRGQEKDDLNGIIAMELASTLDMIRKLKEQVVHIGVLVKSIKKTNTTTKDGTEIEREEIEYKLNPALLALPKLIDDFGLTLPEAMLTPRELARHKIDEKAVETMSDKFTRLGRRFVKSMGKKGDDE